MGVELPQLLVVLAHELRSPVGVLQGYIRLLGRQAGPGETTVFDAMLTATSRLSSLGQDASSLANWLDVVADDRVRAAPRTVADVVSALSAQLPASATVEPPTDRVGAAAVPTRDVALLARALAEVCKAVARSRDCPTVFRVDADESAVVMTVDPVASAPEEAPAHPLPGATPSASSRPFTFNSGGLGLGLVLASYVLDGHRAGVTTQQSGAVDVRLPRVEAAS